MSFCQLLFILSKRSDYARIIFRSNHHPMACMLMTSQMMTYSISSSFHSNKLATVRFLISVVVCLAFVLLLLCFYSLLFRWFLSHLSLHFIVYYLFVVHLADIRFSLHRKINIAKAKHLYPIKSSCGNLILL